MGRTVSVLWDDEVFDEGNKPFTIEHLNTSYRFFSELAERNNMEVLIGRYDWVRNESMKRCFVYDGNNWLNKENEEFDVIFDKFKFDNTTKHLKQDLAKHFPVLNSFGLEELCKDKIKTFEAFSSFVPETLNAEKQSVKKIISKYDKAIIKPRYDFGGEGIYVVDDIDQFDSEDEDDLLVQGFVDSSKGIPEMDVGGTHDLRVVISNGEIVLTYVRTPDEGFISNVSRGGSIEFFENEVLPESIFPIVESVENIMKGYGDRVYAIDFIFDQDGKPWILELNSKPGLSFYEDDNIRKWKKPLMKNVLNVLNGM